MKLRRILLCIAAAVLMIGIGTFFFSQNFAKQEKNDQEVSGKLAKALDTIEQHYVDDVSRDQLIEGAIEGMVSTLEDPFSDYMDSETSKQFRQSLESSFEGIGAEIGLIDGGVTITSPLRDSPAEKAGLRANDRIVEIDGESIEGWSVHEAVSKIRGEGGTSVTLTIQRSGTSDPFQVEITRDTIKIESVRVQSFERDGKTIARLQITSFSENVASQFAEALSELEEKGLDGLIIDVRGNPGGYLHETEKIGNLLIPGGEPIVQVEKKSGNVDVKTSTLKETKPYPIVGLIDESSASASEILAAALKESGGYELVGNTTFGKGTVQAPIEMNDGSMLKITTSRWLTAGGNVIDHEGVEPTIAQDHPDYFYAAALSIEEPLTYDTVSEQTAHAQKILTALGFETGRTDGYFDKKTVKAVETFQQAHDLTVNGELNKDVASRLQEEILTHIRDDKNDVQLNKAIEVAVSKLKSDN
ncbi:S41 family peptidase [Bacillus sp. FSL W7-1360]